MARKQPQKHFNKRVYSNKEIQIPLTTLTMMVQTCFKQVFYKHTPLLRTSQLTKGISATQTQILPRCISHLWTKILENLGLCFSQANIKQHQNITVKPAPFSSCQLLFHSPLTHSSGETLLKSMYFNVRLRLVAFQWCSIVENGSCFKKAPFISLVQLQLLV